MRWISKLTSRTKPLSSWSASATGRHFSPTAHVATQELKSASSLTRLDTADPDPDTQFREYFKSFRMQSTVNPIAYDASIPAKHVSEMPLGGFRHKKVTVVGCGQVGLAIAYSILNQDMVGSLTLVDVNAEKLEGEAKDFLQGSAFHQRMNIEASNEYSISKDSDLVIITAGVAQKVGESRLKLVERNVNIMKAIVPQILTHSPDATICVVSNPCDIMTAVAAKIAGKSVPAGRIFGSGTCLDSSRLQSLIAKSLDLDPNSVHGYVIGEHGDSSTAVWSSVRVGALPILQDGQEPDEVLRSMHREVVNAAGDVIRLKGYTNWAVGLTGAHIAKAVITDSRSIMPVSTCVRGLYGIEEDVFLSVPCSLSSLGVQRIAVLPLTESEKAGFCRSAEQVFGIQQGIWDSI